ncbi:MAG: right-handed parallel beta-helix repeat-containing protein [Candidatus Thermoplasmatota archaeon]|nr:right-handed parallel beta-helix repeat-containing protein [Candidatus Thermoplasmatota archaeon]
MRCSVVVVTLLVVMSGLSSSAVLQTKPTTTTTLAGVLYVGGSGPGNYSRIQDAVDNASAGDTVFVYDDSAPYYESIVVNVSLALVGEDRNTTSIEGGHYAITLNANGVSVSGFRISNVGDFWTCYGIGVLSNDNTVSGNTIVNNQRMNGVYVNGGSYNTISGNIIANNNYHGIRLEYSSHNVVEENRIVNNRGYGIYLWSSTDNLVVGNTIRQSYWEGILIGDTSGGNTVYHNNFIENSRNAYDATGNTWDNGSAGNYWSDYTGVDGNGDGIGDTPYLVPGNVSSDRFPFMEPWGEVSPDVQITVSGGFGVTVSVKNSGWEDLSSLEWRVGFEGAVLLLPRQRSFEGTIPTLVAGDMVEIVPVDLICGVGLMTVNVSVEEVPATMKGFLLLFFFLPVSP